MKLEVGQKVSVVYPFEADLPEQHIEAKIKSVHSDGTVDVDMTPYGGTYKANVPYHSGGTAPAGCFCENLEVSRGYRNA